MGRNKRRNDQFGSYAVVAPVARGGVSDVYLAEHTVTRERVALKVVDKSYLGHREVIDRLLAEHTISRRVRHPGLIDVHLAERNVGGLPYIVMEFLDGENLGDLAERGPIELDAVISIVGQIAYAVAAMHAAGVVHCDLKPDNVVVLYETGPGGWPRIKVVDFGVARTVDEESFEKELISGTPPYMAPEQWRGAPVTRSDVYSLGCLLYELCTGDTPFSGTLPQLMTLHTEEMPARPTTHRGAVPAALERLIMRTLLKDAEMRPTMLDLAHELSRMCSVHQVADLDAVG